MTETKSDRILMNIAALAGAAIGLFVGSGLLYVFVEGLRHIRLQ